MNLKRQIKQNIQDPVILKTIGSYCQNLWKNFTSFIESYNCEMEYIHITIYYIPETQQIQIKNTNFSYFYAKGPDSNKLKKDIEKNKISDDFYQFLVRKHFVQENMCFKNDMGKLSHKEKIYLDIKILKNVYIIQTLNSSESICYPYSEKTKILNSVTPINTETKEQKEFVLKYQQAFIDVFHFLNNHDDLIIHPDKKLFEKVIGNNSHAFIDYKMHLKDIKEKSSSFNEFLDYVDHNFKERFSFSDSFICLPSISIGVKKIFNKGIVYLQEDTKNVQYEIQPIALIE